jgi:glucose-1-phosphate cytidylyltransferase
MLACQSGSVALDAQGVFPCGSRDTSDGDPMKVVIFCGGRGLRLRDYSDAIPKPMVPIGQRPILWHNMRYYAHYGHKEFILCLGYKADVIKDYFLRYNEALSNDFILSGDGHLELLSTDIQDWRIAFVNTGMNALIGQRLRAVEKHVGNDEMFLANYGDNLTDAPLDKLIDDFRGRDKVAAFLSVAPTSSFHVVSLRGDGVVTAIEEVTASGLRINGGYFIFRREIFDYIRPGEELVEQPFQRLIAAGELIAYPHEGFWAPMDTLKDMQTLEAMHDGGRPPWAVWQLGQEDATTPTAG